MNGDPNSDILLQSPVSVLPEPPAPKGSFIRHYGSTVIGQILLLGAGTLTGILAARLLGPVGRGELAAIVIWPSAVAMLLSLGINQAITYNVGQGLFSVDEIVTGAAVVALVQTALCLLIAVPVVWFALSHYPPEVRHLGVIFAAFSAMVIPGGYPGNLFQGKQMLTQFNVLRSVAGLVYLLGVVLLWVLHRGSLTGIAYSQLLGYAVALAVGSYLAWNYFRPRFSWNPAVVSRLLHFGWRTQVTTLTYTFNQRIDQMFLSLFVPAQQLGLYAVAVTLANAVTAFPQAAGIVTFSRGSGRTREEVQDSMRTSLRASFGWLAIGCLALYLLCPFLITLVFGARFSGSVIACRILLPGTLLVGLNQVMYSGASALGRPGLPSIAEGVSVGVTAIGLYLLVPRYGYVGAAIVSSVAYSISFLVMVWMLHNLLGMKIAALFFRASTPGQNHD